MKYEDFTNYIKTKHNIEINETSQEFKDDFELLVLSVNKDFLEINSNTWIFQKYDGIDNLYSKPGLADNNLFSALVSLKDGDFHVKSIRRHSLD